MAMRWIGLCFALVLFTKEGYGLVATTVLSEPWTIVNKDGKLTGIFPDLAANLERYLGQNITLQLVKDGKYGSPSRIRRGEWTGMVGELQRGEVDLALAPLTMTVTRKNVIDFTMPFFTQRLGLLASKDTILVSVPNPENGGVFSNLGYFLSPFGIDSWVLIFLSTAGVMAVFTILNMFDPYEWGKWKERHKIIDKEASGDFFNIRESCWFTFTTFTLQGYNKRPLSLGSRTMAIFWFIFCFIVMATYIAALSHSYAINPPAPSTKYRKLRSVADVLDAEGVELAPIKGGSTDYFLRYTLQPMYSKLGRKMMHDSKPRNYGEAVEFIRDKRRKFIFIADATYSEYMARTECDLVKVGSDDGQSGYYAIALQKSSPLQDQLDDILLRLMESGHLYMILDKWLYPQTSCPSPVKELENKDKAPEPLRVSSFGGSLVLLLIGVITSVIVGVMEIIFYRRKHKNVNKENLHVSKEESEELNL